MAEETKADGKKSSLLIQILVPVAIAILSGGAVPWWLNHNKPAPPAPAPLSASTPTQVDDNVASREFFIGHWQNNGEILTANGMVTGLVSTNFFENGRFEGYAMEVLGNQAEKVSQAGNWQVEILSRQYFRLSLQYDNATQAPFKGTYKIIDHNHIHNTEMNYDAVRVE